MTSDELAEVLKAVNANKPQITQTFNFNATVGQQIAHVDRIEAHFDKDMGMQVFNADEICEPSKSNDNVNHFPLIATTDKLLRIWDSLVSNNFIAAETSREEFLYYFGHVEYKPAELHPITWVVNKSNKQLLRELIIGMYKPMINSGMISKANIERIVPSVFADIKGEPILLAKEKKVLSLESDKIADYLATFHS